MAKPKRVRSNKRIVWSGNKQVWFKNGQFQTYDGTWENVPSDATLRTYDNGWIEVKGDDPLYVYDSDKGTYIGTWEDGPESTYTFKDYDGTVLKTGKVKDGETPVAPADPTREATAEYTYTFSGWNPAVGPIAKNTEYVAQYTATKNTYTVTISSNNTDYGTVDESSVTVEYGTAISASDNVLTIGETEVTATAESGYEFSSWGELPATVTENLSITATFQVSVIAPSSFSIAGSNITSQEGSPLFQFQTGTEVGFEQDYAITGYTYSEDPTYMSVDLTITPTPSGASPAVTFDIPASFNEGEWQECTTAEVSAGVYRLTFKTGTYDGTITVKSALDQTVSKTIGVNLSYD